MPDLQKKIPRIQKIRNWLHENFKVICIAFIFFSIILLLPYIVDESREEERFEKRFPIEQVVFGETYICPYCHIKKDFGDTQSPKVIKQGENQVEVVFRCRHCRKKIRCINNL